jgi:thiol-disulfide isomerase/thioredoxin
MKIFIIILFLISNAFAKSSYKLKDNLSIPFPENITFTDEVSNKKTFKEFEKHTLFVFWATWCNPCRDEMPTLSNFQNTWKNVPIDIYAVSEDYSDISKSTDYLKKLLIDNIKVLKDDNNLLFRELKLVGMPSAAFVDPKGKILFIIQGEVDWQSKEIEDLIKKYMIIDDEILIKKLVKKDKILTDHELELENISKKDVKPQEVKEQIKIKEIINDDF